MTVSDAPQFNRHHSVSFEVTNVLRRVAFIKKTKLIAATGFDNRFADRRIFLNHFIARKTGGILLRRISRPGPTVSLQ